VRCALHSGQDGWGTGTLSSTLRFLAKSSCTSRSLGEGGQFLWWAAGSVCAGALEQASWPVDVEAAASPPSPSTALSAPPRRRPRRRGARQTTYDDLVGDEDDSDNSY